MVILRRYPGVCPTGERNGFRTVTLLASITIWARVCGVLRKPSIIFGREPRIRCGDLNIFLFLSETFKTCRDYFIILVLFLFLGRKQQNKETTK